MLLLKMRPMIGLESVEKNSKADEASIISRGKPDLSKSLILSIVSSYRIVTRDDSNVDS